MKLLYIDEIFIKILKYYYIEKENYEKEIKQIQKRYNEIFFEIKEQTILNGVKNRVYDCVICQNKETELNGTLIMLENIVDNILCQFMNENQLCDYCGDPIGEVVGDIEKINNMIRFKCSKCKKNEEQMLS